jgi:hypothetical protein
MNNPRVLVLVLASDTDPLYCAFQILWRQYMKSHPNIDAYFYKGHPNISQDAFLSDENTLLIKIKEGLDTCYEKTLKAFEFFSNKLDTYDYVFRTNLSSFVYFPHYLNFCKSLPKRVCCAAFIGVRSEDGLQFPAGAGFTLSPDLVKRLIQERPALEVQDDVSIGRALQRWNIPIIQTPRLDILFEDDMKVIDMIPINDSSIFHYRLKNIEGNRNLDIKIYTLLLSKYYSK